MHSHTRIHALMHVHTYTLTHLQTGTPHHRHAPPRTATPRNAPPRTATHHHEPPRTATRRPPAHMPARAHRMHASHRTAPRLTQTVWLKTQKEERGGGWAAAARGEKRGERRGRGGASFTEHARNQSPLLRPPGRIARTVHRMHRAHCGARHCTLCTAAPRPPTWPACLRPLVRPAISWPIWLWPDISWPMYCSYGLLSPGLCSYGLPSPGLCSYGLPSPGLCSYGLPSPGLAWRYAARTWGLAALERQTP